MILDSKETEREREAEEVLPSTGSSLAPISFIYLNPYFSSSEIRIALVFSSSAIEE